MKTYTNCPVCSDTKFTKNITCKDNTGSTESFNIVACDTCNFAFTNPIPLESDLGRYYESESYISHSNTNKGLVNFLYQKVRNHTLDTKISLLTNLSAGQELLDIGCGTGEFLNRAKQKHFNIEGIEPSDDARKQVQTNFSITVHDETHLGKLQNKSFDFITMWHVLEHVYHLNDRMTELRRLLKDDGHIIIAVPNLKSYDAQKYKEHWAAYDLPRHLYHFSEGDVKTLATKHGLTVTKTLPMKFDSYYVSMLSEKYKTGSQSLISAFLTGLKSNSLAKRKGGYSSHIYILKKQ